MRLLIKDLQPGQNYKVQVRSNDGATVSEWSRLFDLNTIQDTLAPSDPTGLTVVYEGTLTRANWSHSGLNTDGSTMKDFAYYEIEIYSDGVTATYRTGLTTFTLIYEYNVQIFGQYKNNVGIRVRAVDSTGNMSNYTSRVFGTDTAPSKPSSPILYKDLSDSAQPRLYVKSDLMKSAGGRLETDVNRVKIYSTASASSTPTVAGSTLLGTMNVGPTDVFAISGTYNLNDYTGKHIFFVATDIGNNDSATSATSPVSGATSALYADVAIFNEAYITYLDANKLRAGTGVIDNLTIKSSITMGATRDPFTSVPAEGNYTFIKSSNYSVGTAGYIIRGDGYAEFRQLAVNSIGIGKFERAALSGFSTKLSDFMEDPTQWGRHTLNGVEEADGGTPKYTTGTMSAVGGITGAVTSKDMIKITGHTAIRRRSGGAAPGLAFDPNILYKVTARVRQMTAPLINFVNNPSAFRAAGAASPAFADLWIGQTFFAGGGTQTASIITTPTHSSGFAQRINHTSLPSYPVTSNGHTGIEPHPIDGSRPLAVQGGGQYTASAYMYLETGTNVKGTIVLATLDSAGSIINGFIGGTQVPLVTGQWVRVDNTYTVESNCASVRVMVLGLNAQSVSQTVQFVIDDVMLTKTSTTVTYFDGSSGGDAAWTGATNDSPSYYFNEYKHRIGLLGFDTAGNLCDVDGGTSSLADDHYMILSDGSSNLDLSNATNDNDNSGWVELTGYVRGRAVSGTSGLAPDPFSPAAMNQSVAYIVPFVELNLDTLGSMDRGLVAELDSFTIEASDALTPQKVSTGDGGITSRAVTIEDIPDDVYGHMVRFFGGTTEEYKPGFIGETEDQNVNAAHTLVIATPQTMSSSGDLGYIDGLKVRGRNPNFISNSSFEQDIAIVTTDFDMINTRFAIKQTNATITQDTVTFHDGWGVRGAKITSVASGNAYLTQRIDLKQFPSLVGETKLATSFWVNNPVAMGAARTFVTGIKIWTADLSSIYDSTLSGTSVTNDGNWTSVLRNYTFTAIDETAAYIDVFFGFTATAASQIVYIDDIMLKTGTAGQYKPQQIPSLRMPGGGAVLGNSVVISDRVSSINGTPITWWAPGRDGAQEQPSVLVENDGLYGMMLKYSKATSAGVQSSYFGMRIVDDQGTNKGPVMLLIDASDQIWPNSVQFYNTSLNATMKIGSNTDPANPNVTKNAKDLYVFGSFRAEGAPTWTAWSSLGTGYSQYPSTYSLATFNSNGITYMRGGIQSASSGTSTTLGTLPVGHRPAQPVILLLESHTATATVDPRPISVIISTAGVITMYRPSTAINSGFFMFDGHFFATATDTTTANADGTDPATPGAASSPSSVSISAYASGVSTGSYKLSWTNPNDTDNANIRIVWRTDRSPTTATDGNVVTTQIINNAAQSYVLSGLPVNKRIYVKLWAINAAGTAAASGSTGADRYLLASPVYVTANSTASYRAGYGGQWRTDNDAVLQGRIEVNDYHKGLWFYGTKITDALNTGSPSAVRQPTKMTIYLARMSSGYQLGPVNVNLYPHTHTTKPGGAPTVVVSGRSEAEPIAVMSQQETGTFTIPSAWYGIIAAGTYRGFAIYNGTNGAYTALAGKSDLSTTGKLAIYHKG